MSPKVARHVILAGDLLWIALSAIAAFQLRTAAPWDAGHLQIATRASAFLISVAGIAWTIIFHKLKLDGFYGGYEVAAVLSRLFTGITALVVLFASAEFLLHRASSRLLLGAFAALFLATAFAWRLVARALARRLAGSGRLHRVLILGNGKIAQELAARIQRHPELRWELVGFLFPSAGDFVDPVLSTGQAWQLNSLRIQSLLKERAVDEVVLTAPVPDQTEMLNLVANCRHSGVRVSIVPNFYRLYVNRPALLELDGLPLLRLAEGAPDPLQNSLKRLFDLALGSVLCLLTTPLMAFSALVLRLQKGRSFLSESRCGRNGRIFRMYRFNCARDTRGVSLAEQVLQMLSVAELPQLWNVLKGDMSLVGPRPETEERVKRYSDWQRQRLILKPGITGLAQVHGLREESTSEEKAYYDLRYIQEQSLLTDVSLILETLWTIGRRLFQLQSPAARGRQAGAHLPHDSNVNDLIELVHADRP